MDADDALDVVPVLGRGDQGKRDVRVGVAQGCTGETGTLTGRCSRQVYVIQIRFQGIVNRVVQDIVIASQR